MHHAQVPIVLMTGHGSEALAVEALQRGAAGYVPKALLGERLLDAIDEALSMSRADRSYEQLISCLNRCEFRFELDNDGGLVDPLVDLVQQMVAGMRLTDATGRFRVGAALKEALFNAIYRGNLEISFKEMQDARSGLALGQGDDLIRKRRETAPHRDRRVNVFVAIGPEEARFVVRDDGPGFEPVKIPAAGQPGSLDPETGRGLVLIRAFMDEVTFNDKGNEITLIKRRET
jgi:signal transduction histidine kinase